MKESKSSKIILVYKTLYGFQKLDVQQQICWSTFVRCVRDLSHPGFTHIISNNKFLPGVEIVDYLTVSHFETCPNDKFFTC